MGPAVVSFPPAVRRQQIRRVTLGLLLAGLAAVPAARATVVTAPLEWGASSLTSGLARLKDQFLDISVGQDVEHVGAVLRAADGTFRFTHGNGTSGQNQVTFRVQRPDHLELVGFWHTHGADGPDRAVFSPTDAELVRALGLPFYLITPEGEIRVLKPEHVRKGGRVRLMGEAGRLPRGAHPGEAVETDPDRRCGGVTRV